MQASDFTREYSGFSVENINSDKKMMHPKISERKETIRVYKKGHLQKKLIGINKFKPWETGIFLSFTNIDFEPAAKYY